PASGRSRLPTGTRPRVSEGARQRVPASGRSRLPTGTRPRVSEGARQCVPEEGRLRGPGGPRPGVLRGVWTGGPRGARPRVARGAQLWVPDGCSSALAVPARSVSLPALPGAAPQTAELRPISILQRFSGATWPEKPDWRTQNE
ncbi:MAG: hypothetical protein GY755_16525, partial [Chloroflexi bacterium]|nr:hypothetical protein [Chloroflexota bacterium]